MTDEIGHWHERRVLGFGPGGLLRRIGLISLVRGGILQGATGVNVNGTLYNVTFVDGSCAQTFTGCDQNSDFQFQTKNDAMAAGQALLIQSFLDGPFGNFDTRPDLTAGCQGNSGFCFVIISYAIAFPVPPPRTSAV